jgi:hypothetical protein
VEKYGYTVEIVADGLQEWYAYELEFNLVCLYGRACEKDGFLVNLTDGGIGPLNPSDETRKKMSLKAKGRTPHNLGEKMSDETKKKLSDSKTGKPNLKLRGRIFPPELVAKMSAARKGKPNGHEGLKRSDQARINMSNAQKNSKNRADMSGDKNPSKRADVRLKMSLAKKGKRTGADNVAARSVICIETNQRFDCIKYANEWLMSIGLKGCVKGCVTGRSKTSGGYTWRYE